ncbi:MAG: phosphodiester glycosidase family protein, partial [Candidatus Cryptobacteroides sp.]
ATLTGKNNYDSVSENYPNPSHNWDPYYAMTAGPLLVKDGKIMTDLSSENGSLVRNYENIASDIFSATLSPDRTTVGYTEDGKVILFVCDGRITQSQGATILEAAQIMKGLGCVGAVNFDGGGSTAMTVKGSRINSLLSNTSGGTENRKVGSVMGFYKKN